MTSSEYWKKREADALKSYQKDEEAYYEEIQEIYADMMERIQKEIDSFYIKYAVKEDISMAEAKKRVSQLDIKAYARKAKKYVRNRDFSDKANEEMRLYNVTMKINRLEMLKANIGLELVSGYDELQKYFEQALTDRTLDEFKRQAGILGETITDNAEMAHSIVNASFHNATFSDRIWMHQDVLKNQLSSLLQTGLIQGRNPRQLAVELRKYFNVSIGNSERLMRTELARVQTAAQKRSFEKNGFEEYEFIANGTACEKCAGLDGQHFKVAKMMPGTNAPPIHPNCRCSTAAYQDSAEYEAWLDFLDKGGSTEEWQNIKRNGQQTGGKWYTPYDKDDTRDVAASKAYRKISRRDDVKAIAFNSGFSEQDIKQIKRHIFFNKHQTYDGYKTLYPDYDMAVAWNRLYKGEQLERDVLLLHHELLESTLEKKYNLTIAEAHRRAKEKYDWEKKLLEDLKEGMEKWVYCNYKSHTDVQQHMHRQKILEILLEN